MPAPSAVTDPSQKMRTLLSEAPAEVSFDEPRLQNVQHALTAGKYGLMTGAALGALRAAMQPKEERNFLRDTLAGALLGGLGAGGTSYIAGLGPFAQAAPAAKGFEAGKAVALRRMLEPGVPISEVAQESLMTGLAEVLSGKHEFTPEEQKALAQQFVKAKVPTSSGWRRRVNLTEQVINQLAAAPQAALPGLKTLEQVAPDPEVRTYAAEAAAQIRSGRAMTPEGRNAIAAIGQAIASKLPEYRRATHTIDALNIMKEMYGAGQLSEEDVAKNVGLITGRFGPATERAESLRSLLQSAFAQPVPLRPASPYPTGVTPTMANLVARAMQ